MWIADLRLLLFFGFCFCTTTLAYHGLSSKQEYIKWREREIYNSKYGPRRTMTTTTPVSTTTSENDIYYDNLKLRHQSRYPHLDRVMSKIDSLQTTNAKKSTTSGAGSVQHHRVRHEGWISRNTYQTTTTDEGLFDEDYDNMEYEDEENNDDWNEYDEWEEGENDDDDYDDETSDDDNDPFSSDEDDTEWQAEEATDPPATAVPVPVSQLTKYKWENYGTRSRVEESRRQQLNLKPNNEQRAANAVVDHYMKIRQEGQCRRPLPKVIPVQREHPDPSKTYTPHCTILHRCAEDTGCCTNFETRCGPKKQVPVDLYFYTKTLGVPETKVERLTFYNHTECACLEKSKIATSTPAYLEDSSSSSWGGLSVRSANHRGAPQPENLSRCKCPVLFIPKFRFNSRCTCDCEDHNESCQRMKKGQEYLGMEDRKCIKENKCGIPVCEYGIFLKEIGRCQRDEEKMSSYRKFRINY